MTDFNALPSLLGGMLIGTAASLLLWGSGQVAGVSGIAAGLMARDGGRPWRTQFLGGLIAGGVILRLVAPQALGGPVLGFVPLALAGLLVGVGTRIGGGCTSGHGVCGLSRLSPRSLVAVVVFMLTAMLTVAALRQAGAL